MSNASNINSLAALRERREELAAEEQTAIQGLTSSLAAAPAKAKDYALEDLALPALGIGLAAYVGYRLLRSGKSKHNLGGEQPAVIPAQTQWANDQPAPVSRAAAAAPQRSVQASRPVISGETKKGAFNLATVVAAGKLLIPAAQAIIGVVQNQQEKQDSAQAID